MAVPTALATSISYKGTSYPFGTPVTFTELNPLIEVTYDVADFIDQRVVASNSEIGFSANYKEVQHIGESASVSVLVLRLRLRLDETMDVLAVTAYNADGYGTERAWTISVDLTTASQWSWQGLGRAILRETLQTNLTVGELAVVTETINAVEYVKILWEDADDQFAQPYIILQYMAGGDTNRSQAREANMTWKVVIHTNDQLEATQMEQAIHRALAYRQPVVNFTGLSGISVIEEILPVTDRYSVSNQTLFVSGGIYRLRLIKEA